MNTFTDSEDGTNVSEMGHLYFGSAMKPPYHCLSNFALIQPPLSYNGEYYPSAEHAMQACLDMQGPEMYTTDGVIGVATVQAFSHVYNANEAQRKMDYWMKKENVGILAKMQIKASKNAGMKRDVTPTECFNLWMPILRAKYERADFRKILLATGDKHLVEFDRGAIKKGSRWGGLVNADKVVVGSNNMGRALMQIREELNAANVD